MSFDDFEDQKVVLISDEAHHLNVDTKKKMSAEESESYHSWEQTVKNIFYKNPDNVLLEFTATCDLENPAIKAAYESRIVFNYPLEDVYKRQVQSRSSEESVDLILIAAAPECEDSCKCHICFGLAAIFAMPVSLPQIVELLSLFGCIGFFEH